MVWLPPGSELTGLSLLSHVWSLGWGQGHWFHSQRLTHLMDSILQCSR